MSKITSLPNYALDVESTKRLVKFQETLGRDYDSRNYDYDLSHFLESFLRMSWQKTFKETKHYLKDLRNPENGKLFSQGVKEYSKLLEAGHRFAEPNNAPFSWNEHFKAAKRSLIEEFKQLRKSYHFSPLRYTCDQDIISALPRKDTHAGFSYILTGKKEKRDNLDNIFSRVCDLIKRSITGDDPRQWNMNIPILPGVRTQGTSGAFEEDGTFTGTCKHKTRFLSIIDNEQICIELIYAKPIQEALSHVSWYAGGKSFDKELSSLVTSGRYHFNKWTSLDYSAYDQSISAWLIEEAFDVARYIWEIGCESELNYDFMTHRLYRLVINSFIHKEFILDGETIVSHKGVPSGSMFTQIIDSIVNRLMIDTFMRSKGVQGYQMIVMGDDNIIFHNDDISLRELSSYLNHNFGITCHPDKCRVGSKRTYPHFLSTDWMDEGRYRSPYELFAKLLYPERKRIYNQNRTKPWEVLYSYYLAYPVAMMKVFDIDKLLRQYPYLNTKRIEDFDTDHLPGFLKYQLRYLRPAAKPVEHCEVTVVSDIFALMMRS